VSWTVILIGFLCGTTASAQTLRIYHIDVEQADSTLIVMPNGKTLLIDAGKNKHGKRIKAVMDRAGVTQIDAFVASHYHEDHFGGIDNLIEQGVTVLEAYDRGRRDTVKASDKAEGTYKDYMREVGEDAHALKPGDVINLDSSVTVTCIASSGAVLGTTPVATNDENNLSVTLLVEFAGFKALFGGDSHMDVEQKIATVARVQGVDLYKSDHHGSDTSSDLAFMTALAPSLIVISNGSNASYHHPRSTTLQHYLKMPGPPLVLQTNRCKAGSPCDNVGAAFIADPEQHGKDGTIQLTIDATTRTVTAAYGINTIRTFAFKNGGAPTTPLTIAIQSLLPNPAGDDEQLEEVTLRNPGPTGVALAGWTLRDRSGLVWNLSGTVTSGGSLTIKRGGQPMSLNNGGDEITLIDSSNVERDRFAYLGSQEGKRILTTH
jgi:beta-lactamase superfamily II metal-dependent hydrolase